MPTLSDHTINLAMLVIALGTGALEFGIWRMMRAEYRKPVNAPDRRSVKWWLDMTVMSFGPLLVVVAIALTARNINRPKAGEAIGYVKDMDTGVVSSQFASPMPTPSSSSAVQPQSTPLPEFAKYSNAGNGWPRLPLSDGEKWHFAQWKKKAASSDSTSPRGCTIVFVRYQESSAEDLVTALGDILDAADWKYKQVITLDVLPKGISVLSAKPNDNCAINFSNGVRQFAEIQVLGYSFKNTKTSEMAACGDDCIEVEVGNVPNL